MHIRVKKISHMPARMSGESKFVVIYMFTQHGPIKNHNHLRPRQNWSHQLAKEITLMMLHRGIDRGSETFLKISSRCYDKAFIITLEDTYFTLLLGHTYEDMPIWLHAERPSVTLEHITLHPLDQMIHKLHNIITLPLSAFNLQHLCWYIEWSTHP
jgi:hypothetical protein